MNYDSKLILDSISNKGCRITTFEITMPKWLQAEFNTHRVFSRNSASSRAVPTKAIVETVLGNPVIPIDWRYNESGMQANTIMTMDDTVTANDVWLRAMLAMLPFVKELQDLKADKQRTNRLLEPWMWTQVVVTATEWNNFFNLRDNAAAQPEFGHIAALMHQQYIQSMPVKREWHLPYIMIKDAMCIQIPTDLEKVYTGLKNSGLSNSNIINAAISAAKCGRVTHYKQGLEYTLQENFNRGMGFARDKHLSPLEHPAQAGKDEWYGPFYGWKSFRKFLPDEAGGDRTR